ncbi:DNA cytosine methyltransferase [Candidatus Gottesmanbacteria bacterium]|nr:DNA cytosine methyltransferase [Candidatus Gottesmanbacteria bacterium]
MNELSLFTGGLGGVLATHCLMGWRQIGYVEIDKYCQKIIAQRIKDGLIPEAPIFGDIRAFINDGFAASYSGMVDVITAGFPCQPFSVAGKQLGENDPRNLWPETIECIRIIRPHYAFMENVPGLLAHPYARRIFGDLAESGYDVRWCVLSAAEVGAPHKRDRVFIFIADANREWRQRDFQKKIFWKSALPWGENIRSLTDLLSRPAIPVPLIRRMADGGSGSMAIHKALGNGQVPRVVATAWELLAND